MKKILVIEDETAVRENLVELLRAEGYLPLEARDGEDGLRVVWNEKPDLILCDIRMPRLDGYGVLARLNQDAVGAVIPFIFLSARTERSDMRMGMNLGAEDYITKPFSRNDILDAVKKRLDRRELLEARSQVKLEEIQQKMSYSLPHELLTPLSIILSRSESLVEDTEIIHDATQVRSVGKEIREASGKLLRLIQNYLDYAEFDTIERDEKLTNRLRLQSVNAPNVLIEEIGSSLSKELSRMEDLRLSADPGTVAIAENYFLRIVEFLITNALTQSQVGTSVELTARILTEQNVYSIRIRDEGRGLTDDEIREINGQIPSGERKYELQGNVLQYLFVRKILHFFYGKFNIESIQGKGTTVDILLPCRPQ
jgi:two-component system, sensor histidine kinase and response regulator